MKIKKVDSVSDIELVRSFFYDIFIDEWGYDLSHYYDSLHPNNQGLMEFYIAYEGSSAIGITGIYATNLDDCWLGWFGIREGFRRKGYATKLLMKTLEMMLSYGFKGCRLYTNRVVNAPSVSLYSKFGFVEDSVYKGDVITMKKPLISGYVMPDWFGRPLEYVEEYPISPNMFLFSNQIRSCLEEEDFTNIKRQV